MPQKEQRDEQCECLITREPDLPPASRWVGAVEGVGRSFQLALLGLSAKRAVCVKQAFDADAEFGGRFITVDA